LVTDNDSFMEYHPNFFLVKDRAMKEVLLGGRSVQGLYPVPSSPSLPSSSSRQGLSGVKLSVDHWHRRLGHRQISVVESVLRTNNIACARPHEPSVCDACQQAKIHKLPFARSLHSTKAPLELVHSDVWGPAVKSVGGFRYYVSFVDDFTRFSWIYLLKRKSNVESAFYSFQAYVERQLDTKIRMFQSDWGGVSTVA
jgi:histone deacetylase 1/2